jgi:hypothetical protein
LTGRLARCYLLLSLLDCVDDRTGRAHLAEEAPNREKLTLCGAVKACLSRTFRPIKGWRWREAVVRTAR